MRVKNVLRKMESLTMGLERRQADGRRLFQIGGATHDD